MAKAQKEMTTKFLYNSDLLSDYDAGRMIADATFGTIVDGRFRSTLAVNNAWNGAPVADLWPLLAFWNDAGHEPAVELANRMSAVDVYTLADWRRDGAFCASPGDLVSNDVVNMMFDGAEPVFDRDGLFQCSTPRDHHNGRPTFPTFRRERDLWRYCGMCHAGQNRMPN